MRVLFTSTSGSGHFQPLLPLVHAFLARDDDVLVVVPGTLASTLEGGGFEIRSGGEPSAEDRNGVWSQFPKLERRDASRLIEREWFATLCLEAMLPSVTRAVEEWSPHLVVRETCEYAAAVVADAESLPQAQIGISTAAAESRVLQRLVAATIDERRPGLSDRLFRAPYLTKFPSSLDPSPYPVTVRYREFDDVSPEPLADWWPGNDAPLIYVTLGTMAMRVGDGVELLREILAALAGLDARILVTTGLSTSPEELGVVARNVRVERWVNQVDVMVRADLVICHGGSGTVFGALGAGVPLVLVPMFADQPTNSRMVEDAGAGVSIAAGGKSVEENLREVRANLSRLRPVVSQVLEESAFRNAAQLLAKELRTAESPSTLADRLASFDPDLFVESSTS